MMILNASSAMNPTATAAASVPITATGLLSLLSEPSPVLKHYALTQLLLVVDTLWHEIAHALPDLEALSEEVQPPSSSSLENQQEEESIRHLAAAVASRVFFHLEEPFQALRLALESGETYFHSLLVSTTTDNQKDTYIHVLMGAAIEAYIVMARKRALEQDSKLVDSEEEEEGTTTKTTTTTFKDLPASVLKNMDPTLLESLDANKLLRLVHVMFQTCFEDLNFKYALGIAMEAREVHLLSTIFTEAQKRCLVGGGGGGGGEGGGLLSISTLYPVLAYAIHVVSSSTTDDTLSTSFRYAVLNLVAQHVEALIHSVSLDREVEEGGMLDHVVTYPKLVTTPEEFKVFANLRMKCILSFVQIQQRLKKSHSVAKILNRLLYGGRIVVPSSESEAVAVENVQSILSEEDEEKDLLLALQIGFHLMDSGDQNYVDSIAQALVEPPPTSSGKYKARLDKLKRILVGGFSSELSLSFLHKYSDSDRLIMEHLKKTLEERGGGRNSVYHNCALVTHSYLNAGTTNDSFLRDNLDWMKKASNWAKFSATASLGVVHARHITEAMSILQPYLPPTPNDIDPNAPPAAPVSSTGGYAEGGSLYALGIIHGCDTGSCSALRKQTNDLLRSHLRSSHANEAISHGAALGVGLTAMGTHNLQILQELKEVLYTDSAVAGEAAALAIGLVLVGSGATNTTSSIDSSDQGVAVGMEISELVRELQNYAKETQHEKIIRGIAMALALINYGQEDKAADTINEMNRDRDPIIRYGAQYAIGLAFCGTGSNKAIRSLLHAAVSDVNDDVRSAAVISLAFVLYKTPERVPHIVKLLLESFNPHVRYASCMAVGIAMAGTGDAESIALLEPMLTDMTDFVRQGALLGTSMIYMQQSDACNGRKVIQFREKLSSIIADKHQTLLTKMGAILGTGIIDAGGRNCLLDLGSLHGFTKMTNVVGLTLWLQHWHWFPMMHMLSLALTPTITIGLNKDMKFPKSFSMECRAKPSTFSYPKRLEEKKEEKKKRVETVSLSITSKVKARLARKKAKEEVVVGSNGTHEDTKAEAMETDEADVVTVKKKREPEPNNFRLFNPCRVTKAQVQYCEIDFSQRYRPIQSEDKPFGIVILTDSQPDEADNAVGSILPPSMGAEDEADPPEPFEWSPDSN